MPDPTPQDHERDKAQAVAGKAPDWVWVVVKPSGYATKVHLDYHVVRHHAVAVGEEYGDQLVRYVPATALAEQREQDAKIVERVYLAGGIVCTCDAADLGREDHVHPENCPWAGIVARAAAIRRGDA